MFIISAQLEMDGLLEAFRFRSTPLFGRQVEEGQDYDWCGKRTKEQKQHQGDRKPAGLGQLMFVADDNCRMPTWSLPDAILLCWISHGLPPFSVDEALS